MATAGAAPPTAGAPVHERAPRRRLPRTPDQPFGDRVVMWGEGAGSVIRDLLLLGMHLAFLGRSSLLPPALAWQCATCGAILLHMALGMLWPSRHRRLRNLLLLLLRSTSLGLGVGGASVWDAVNGGGGGALGGLGPGAPGPREMLAQLARLLYASCALPLAVSSALLPLPFGYVVLSQLVLVSTLTPHVRRGCSRALMAAPRAQRATRALYASLGWVGMPLPLPLAPFARPDAVAECATIVHWLQLGFGLLLPLYLSALSTAAAFREHQRQRAAAQLPPERGIMAAFYTAVDEWVGPDGTFPPAVLGWVMLAACWDFTAFLTAPGTHATTPEAAAHTEL